ncbi:hypothetical protein CIRG_00804 [Coccidioides immitis RMSCC 2394]|uniref:Uncharacterized protein n=1 Tax=Coccidioides immitis RMSCC 2394 TaxID=404692 RepID=A0A0J7ATN9_COCIT|nr:hypothetical protein CIRG_00804 [Coccidioides immitis RMSCC 2394]
MYRLLPRIRAAVSAAEHGEQGNDDEGGTIFRLRGEEVQLVTEPRARLIAKPHPGTLSVLNSRSACYSPTGTDDGMSADHYSDHSLGAGLPMAERSRGWEVLKKPLNF